jgi:hypothetical protein
MDIWTWRILGVMAVVASVFAYRTDWPESPIAATVAFFAFSIWAIASTNVTESAGVCCTYTYEYQSLMYLGILGAAVSALSAVNGVLEGFGADGIRERLNKVRATRGPDR